MLHMGCQYRPKHVESARPRSGQTAPSRAIPAREKRMQSAMKTPVEPWYKHLWPWIIIGMLAISVFLSLMMVNIAVNNQDSLVSDNYYEAGKGINRSLDREHLAQQLKLQAKISFDELTGEVDLRLSGASHPDKLTLNLLSPTLEAQDKDRKSVV